MHTDPQTKLDIHINYRGHCEKAFQFYQEHLGGAIQLMLLHQRPPAGFPAEWKNPILHVMMEIGGRKPFRHAPR